MRQIILIILSLIFTVGCNYDKLSKKELMKAKVIFGSNCAYCHGEDGYGDGSSASSFNPPPRNFHLPTEKWVNGKTVSGVEKTLKEGILPNMWAYKGDDETISLLAKYVIYLGNKEQK